MSRWPRLPAGWVRGATTSAVELTSGTLYLASSVISDSQGACLLIGGTSNVEVVSSTLTNCSTGIDVLATSTVLVEESIVYGHTFGDLVGASCTGVRRSAMQATCCSSNENLCVAPRFVDPGAGDYRLAADSPCVDSGSGPDEFAGAPCLDYAGRRRLLDADGDGVAQADRGAFERVAEVGLPPGSVDDLAFAGADTLVWTGDAPGTVWRVHAAGLALLGFDVSTECVGTSEQPSFVLSGETPLGPHEGRVYLVAEESEGLGSGTCAARTAPPECP